LFFGRQVRTCNHVIGSQKATRFLAGETWLCHDRDPMQTPASESTLSRCNAQSASGPSRALLPSRTLVFIAAQLLGMLAAVAVRRWLRNPLNGGGLVSTRLIDTTHNSTRSHAESMDQGETA